MAGLMNSCAPISALDRPLRARRATCASCAVRSSCGLDACACGRSRRWPAVRAAPVRRTPRRPSRRTPRRRCAAAPGRRGGVARGAATRRRAGGRGPAPMRTRARPSRSMASRRGLGGVAVGEQRARAGLDAQGPVGPAGAGCLGEPLKACGRDARAPRSRRPPRSVRPAPTWRTISASSRRCLPGGGQRLLIAAQTVAQRRGHVLDDGQPFPSPRRSASLPRPSRRGSGLGFPAPRSRKGSSA